MNKNVASQKVTLLAIDTSTNAPKTGDAANLTAYVSKDDGAVTVLADTSATEKDATNAPGLYDFDVAQAESNADKLVFSGKSSTANVKVIPTTIYTRPANASLTSIDSNGRLDVIKIAGTTQTAADVGGIVSSGTHGNAALNTKLGTPVGASVSADIAAIEAQTDDIGAAGAGLTAITTDLAAILVDTSTTLDDLVDDLESRLTAALAAKLSAHSLAVLELVVDAGSTTTAVVFKTVNGGAPSATNDFYNGQVIKFTSGALAGQATSISDYVGATVTATVVALTGAPAEDVTAVIE